MIILLLLFFAIPAFILFGTLGVSFYAIWKLLLFLLKYCLPAAILGLVVAGVRNKNYGLDARDYCIHIAVPTGICLAAVFLWMLLPAKIQIPAADQVTSLTSVYQKYDGTYKKQEAWEQYQIDEFIEDMEQLQLRRTLTEFIKIEEDEGSPYEAWVVCEDGSEYVYTFHSDRIMSIRNGKRVKYYRTKKDTPSVPKDRMSNLFTAYVRVGVQKTWAPFANEFFDSIHYDSEDGMVYFCIPENIPEGRYSIRTDITTVEFLEDGRENKQTLEPFSEEQKNSTWDPGHWYSFPLPEAKYITFDFDVNVPNGVNFSFDLMPQIPVEYHRYPW